MSDKHFNMGNVFGRVVVDSVEHKQTSGKVPFINFQVNISGRRSGSARAFCRMFKKERFEPLLKHLAERPLDPFFFRSFFDQFWDERNTIFTTFTAYKFEQRDSDPRAAFILKGEVDIISAVKLGQRMLMNVNREGSNNERLELWLQDEKMLDIPQAGQMVEVKGYLRQERPEDDFGGSSGPVLAFVEELRIL